MYKQSFFIRPYFAQRYDFFYNNIIFNTFVSIVINKNNNYMKSFLKTLLAAFIGSLVAMGICLFIFFAMISAFASLSDSSAPSVPSSAILKIDLSQQITEQSKEDPMASLQSFDLSNATSRSLGIYSIVKAINRAASDPSIKFIYLTPSQGMQIGFAQLEELRSALTRFRLSGKPVIAYANNFTPGSYYLCSVADKVYMNNSGTAIITGISTSMFFVKDLLNKLGVEVQLIRHGKYKAAGEMFIANNISTDNREQNQVMISSIWNTWANSISESRKVSISDINYAVNNLKLGMPKSMIEANLIDDVLTHSQLVDKICTLYGVKQEKEVQVISLPQYIKATETVDLKTKNKIAVLYADGEIVMDGQGISAKEFVPMIKKIKADSTIKALILRVNSPGGDAQAAESINSELQLLRKDKPLIISFSNYAASGGYWISAQSDKIFTNNTTITGSIGVFSMFFNVGKGLKDNLKINTVSIGSNDHADMISGLRPLNEQEQKYMESYVEDVYSQFTTLVSKGRRLPVASVDSIGQGRVWTGADAINIKLADSQGGLQEAVEYTASLLSLKKYRIAEYPIQKSAMEQIMEMFSDSNSTANAYANPAALFEMAYSKLKDFNGAKIFARLPYVYEFYY